MLTLSVRNGWGVTAIDTLSAAVLLEDKEIVAQILAYVPTIDFTTTAVENEDISLFETNIRYLGGLISGMLLVEMPWEPLILTTSRLRSS